MTQTGNYLRVVDQMRLSLAREGLDAEAAAVEQSLRCNVSQAIEVGWKLLYLHDIQFYLTFEEELLAFHCLSHKNDATLRQAARQMLQDYVDKNEDQVSQFLGRYNACCAPFLFLTQRNVFEDEDSRSFLQQSDDLTAIDHCRTTSRRPSSGVRNAAAEKKVLHWQQRVCQHISFEAPSTARN